MDNKARERIISAVISALEASLERGVEPLLDEGEFHGMATELEEGDLEPMEKQSDLIVRLVLGNDRFQEIVDAHVNGALSELAYAARERLGIEQPEDTAEEPA